jgi:hypothetical protein
MLRIHFLLGYFFDLHLALRMTRHSFFLQVERFNVISGNLGAGTIRTYAGLKSDLKPASMSYISLSIASDVFMFEAEIAF